jgi:large subunit ribosomal protein L5
MADATTAKKAAKPAAPAPEKKAKGGGPSWPTDPAPKTVEGTPRLRAHYEQAVRPALVREFGLTNPMQLPRLVKIVLNVGLGEASKNPKQLDMVVEELAMITGQRPVITRAKKAISNFSLRAGMPVGARVTLRGARMWEFLDRLINLTLPRVRDFRGMPTKSFDGRGNYTVGVKEQMIFPEIDFDKVEKIHGMDITIVTTAGRDALAMALLREFGWPFRGETPPRVDA